MLDGFPHTFVVWLWTNYCLPVIALQVLYMWPTYCQTQDTSPFPFRNAQSTPSKVSLDTKGSPYIPLYIKWASQRPPFHLDSFATRLNIMNALKLTKCREHSKYDISLIICDSIDVREVKFLPSSINGNIIFVLLPLLIGLGMDGLGKNL